MFRTYALCCPKNGVDIRIDLDASGKTGSDARYVEAGPNFHQRIREAIHAANRPKGTRVRLYLIRNYTMTYATDGSTPNRYRELRIGEES